VRGRHRIVELLEEGIVFFFAVLLSEAQGLDAFDENFSGVGLSFDELNGFGEVILERHGAWIGRLAAAHELGLDVGWDEFEDFNAGGLELVTQGLSPGVNGGLAGVVTRGERHRDEGQAGGDGDDGGVGLLEEMWEQRGGEADRTEEIGGDDGFGVCDLFGLGEDVFRAHDAGVVDDDVEGGEVGGELCSKGANLGGVFNIEDCGAHAGVGCDGVVENLLSAAGDDDFVAKFVEGLGEAAADTGTAAGDEDGIAGDIHSGDLS
jgi:hypothetical protein